MSIACLESRRYGGYSSKVFLEFEIQKKKTYTVSIKRLTLCLPVAASQERSIILIGPKGMKEDRMDSSLSSKLILPIYILL